MRTPDEVAAMVRLKGLGWGIRRIAAEFGCSHETVRRYVAAGGWVRTGSLSEGAGSRGWRSGWRNAFGSIAGTATWFARIWRGSAG